jgi:hypothetical protein
MDEIEKLIKKMGNDYDSLIDVAEKQIAENMVLLEKEGSKAQTSFIHSTLKDAKKGILPEAKKFMETFNNLK